MFFFWVLGWWIGTDAELRWQKIQIGMWKSSLLLLVWLLFSAMSLERPRLVWTLHHCSANWSMMKCKDYLWISEPKFPCSDGSSCPQINKSLLLNIDEFSSKFCFLTRKSMGVVRDELICDFTANISIVENRNTFFTFKNVHKREISLYRLAVFILSGNGEWHRGCPQVHTLDFFPRF